MEPVSFEDKSLSISLWQISLIISPIVEVISGKFIILPFVALVRVD